MIGQMLGAADRTSYYGAGGGAAIGAFFGPIGALVGGLIGGAASALLGGKKTYGAQSFQADVTDEGLLQGFSAVDVKRSGGLLRSDKYYTQFYAFDEEQSDQLNAPIIAAKDFVEAIAMELGASVEALDQFTLDSRARVELSGLDEEGKTKAINDFVGGFITDTIQFWIDETEGLSDVMKKTVTKFNNNVEDMLDALQSVAAIELVQTLNLRELADALVVEKTQNATEKLIRLSEALSVNAPVLAESIEGIKALTEEYTTLKGVQVELIATFTLVRREIEELIGTTRQNILEFGLAEEQLYAIRQQQFDTVIAQLQTAVDPTIINGLINDAIGLLNQAFFETLGSDEQRLLLKPEFLTTIDEILALGNQQLAIGEDLAENLTVQLDEDITNALVAASQVQLDASTTFADAVERFTEYLDSVGFNELTL